MATTMEDATAAAAAPPPPALGAPMPGPAAPRSDPPGERSVPPTDAPSINLEGAPAPTPQPASPNPSVPPPQPPSTPSTTIRVGGPNGSNGLPAYALLAGVLEPTNDLVALPMTRLPATLGKEHETRDQGFVGLKEPPSAGEGGAKGAAKLSKSMAVVYYRDRSGGRLGMYKKGKHSRGEATIDAGGSALDGMTYRPHVVDAGDDNETKKAAAPTPDDIIRATGDAAGSLPSNGFYAIECACRAILVNGRLLKKGQSAVLEHGTPIRMGPYCLYFLLPEATSSAEEGPPMLRLRTASPAKVDQEEGEAAASPAKATAKAVAKAMVVAAPPGPEASAAGDATTNPKAGEKTKSAGGGNAKTEGEAAAAAGPPKKKAKKSTKEIEASLESQSDTQLLAFLARKVTEEGPWGQEGQKLGAALAVRACKAAAHSVEMQQIVRKEGGVTQRDLVEWMNAPGCPFRDYERLMLGKIEKKSFMMGLGKAIVRAGYSKNEAKSGAGRAHRWLLPGMAPPVPAGVAAEMGGGGAETAPAAAAKAAEETKANAAPSPAAGGGVAEINVSREPTAAAPGGETTEAP